MCCNPWGHKESDNNSNNLVEQVILNGVSDYLGYVISIYLVVSAVWQMY